ncbi:MAG: hypothetical protein Q7U73_07105 [Rubrivivax sp.]|nr:hypothetical protein [Rubrivivax sp.]
MPYYVYAVKPFAQLEKLAEFAAFKEASTHAKALRQSKQVDAATRIKVMFADNPLAAEDLLLQVREAGPSGDE